MSWRLNNRKLVRQWPTAVDLYSGSGSVTAALKKNHFRVVAAVDNDKVACATFRANHPGTRMIEEDIRKVSPAEIRRRDLAGKNLDLLIVCAPCQPFSSQNRKRGPDDRARLILEAIRFIKGLKPRLVFFENVPGLVSARNANLIDELRRRIGREYVFGDPHRVDAADFQVPQRRVRCIMLAARKSSPPALPAPTSPADKRITVRDAIGKLHPLRSGQTDRKDALHAARRHQAIALRRLAAVPKNGGSRSALPQSLKLECHSGVENSKFSDVYGRMSWNDVAPTLTTGCTDITRGRFAHPTANRAITLREASLLQTFPPKYRFVGSASDIQMQIGNAVPFKLIDAFAPVFRTAIRDSRA
ncbi:MAG: DNA cytosine methyltransferase [Proteobacteria bacterium]|nr:DNA cytosine methyltransferase [Pseudomonadota bacterium]